MTVSTVKHEARNDDPSAFVGGLDVAGGPAWLADLRRQAAQRFQAAGLPTPRVEEWKFTDLRGLARQSFASATGAGRVPADLPLPGSPRLVFVDGRYDAEASSLDGLPEGVEVGPLSVLLGDGSEVNASRRAFEDEAGTGGPVDLNTALADEGAVLRVGRGVTCEAPINLVFVGGGEAGTAYHPRNLMIVEENASVSVLERHVGAGGGTYFANQVVRIDVAAGARLRHAVIQDAAAEAYLLSAGRVTVARDATYEGFILSVGARLSRHEVTVRLTGEGADCNLSGAYLLRGEQHSDMTTFIHHEVPHTSCREVFKGVVDDRSRGVFQGRIVVHKGADKTDGQQSSRAILLSEHATVDAKPELEIYADDVKCAHGATAGELDAAALFYLRSRGIPEARARALLIQAFVDDAVDGITDERLREAVRARAAGWLGDDR